MFSLLKFEINRSKGITLLLVTMMTLFGVLLLIIDADHEEIVITISVLKLLLPFLLIVIMDLVHTSQDLRLDTKNLYLAIPKSTRQIIAAKMSFAVLNYTLFFMMVFVFNGVDVFNGFAPFYTISIIGLGLLIEFSVLLFTIHSWK
jgi:hypothetical protein